MCLDEGSVDGHSGDMRIFWGVLAAVLAFLTIGAMGTAVSQGQIGDAVVGVLLALGCVACGKKALYPGSDPRKTPSHR